MKKPQTYANDLCNLPLELIAEFGCCAFVTMWALGINKTDIEAIYTVAQAMKEGALKMDCKVKWYDFAKFLGKPISVVEFRDIDSLKGIKARTPVRYDYNGKSHWVGVENGKIKFNPIKESFCVKYGKPATARILTLKK